MTFRQWLRTQKYRDDPIGDFSRDFLADKTAKGLHNITEIRRHVLVRTVEPCVLSAVDEAIAEFTKLEAINGN